LDVITLSSGYNCFLVATGGRSNNSTIFIVKIIQNIPITILTIDPYQNQLQSDALGGILENYQDRSIYTLFPISGDDKSDKNDKNDKNSPTPHLLSPRGNVCVTAISSDPRSKHQMMAVSYALYPYGYNSTSSGTVKPLYQAVVCYSGISLLPIIPIFHSPSVHPVIQLDYDTMISNSTVGSGKEREKEKGGDFTKNEKCDKVDKYDATSHVFGMPFSEVISTIEISRTGLHLLLTTALNHVYIYSLFTAQWIRYVGDGGGNGPNSGSNLSSSNPNLNFGSNFTNPIFSISSLILKDTLRLVTSDSIYGSEYKLDSSGLYDHISYILTLLPHGRKDLMEQSSKLLDTISNLAQKNNQHNQHNQNNNNGDKNNFLNFSPQQIENYKQQLNLVQNTQVRITGINTNIRFVLLTTDKTKTRTVTLMSFDTHSLIPHSDDDKNEPKLDKNDKIEKDDKIQNSTQLHSTIPQPSTNTSSSTKTTRFDISQPGSDPSNESFQSIKNRFGLKTNNSLSNHSICGGMIRFNNLIQSFYSFSSLQLPRIELISSKKNILLFDFVRKILIIASGSGDRDVFFLEIHKKFLSELNLPQIQTTAHKEAARRASIISPSIAPGGGLGGQNGQSGALANILPYVTPL